MRSIINRQLFSSCAKTGVLGLALISLAGCTAGESSPGTVTTGGSAALSGPLVFVNNAGDPTNGILPTMSTIALRGNSGNTVINTLGPGVFGGLALGDMQFSLGEWTFLNVSGLGNAISMAEVGTQVATIDPLTGATPVHEINLTTGTRPVHIYRDPTDQEVMWSMNDGLPASVTNAPVGATPGDDLVNCNNPARVGGPIEGGSVTILHNSHLGPGATPPTVERTVCVLADGHKVTAFSRPTTSRPTLPRYAFVSSSTAGEIAVIDNTPVPGANPNWRLINRIDLCDPVRELTRPVPATCNDESSTPLTTAFTPNNSNPHGIRFSQWTGMVYSIQESYRTIVEIDPASLVVTPLADLSGTNYTAFGITPNGRFLLLRGSTTPVGIRLGVIDLSTPNPRAITDLTIPELDGASPGAFKFSPDGRRFYILAGTASTTKRDTLFAFDSTNLAADPLSLSLLPNGEIRLVQGTGTGAHSFDVLVQRPSGSPAGTLAAATYLAVSNGAANSISIISATDNLIKQNVSVGTRPGAVMVYYPGAAAGGHQATSSVTGGASLSVTELPERLDDHGMPE
jgi:hypothetical protein